MNIYIYMLLMKALLFLPLGDGGLPLKTCASEPGSRDDPELESERVHPHYHHPHYHHYLRGCHPRAPGGRGPEQQHS